MIKKTALLLTLLISSHTYAAQKTLLFATSADYPPIVSQNAQGQIVGFEPEVIHAMCNKLKEYDCKLIHKPWNGLLSGLKTHKYDAIFGAFSITRTRNVHVLFTEPLYNTEVGFLAPTSIKDDQEHTWLKDKTIGVQKGSVFQQFLKNYYRTIAHIKVYDTMDEAFIALKEKQIDGIFGDLPILDHFVQKNNYQLLPLKDENTEHYFDKGNAIAVNKNNTKLLHELNKALLEISADGQYQIIYKKYFGKDQKD